jgi:2-keto-3-deoxy-L-rhamnonate aldolase RhmA
LLAHVGFDWLMIDVEHGPISIETAHAMIAATAGTDVTPLVRVPQNLPWLAKPALDAGAGGIVYPQLSTREDAAAAARSTHYPRPGSARGGPSTRLPGSGSRYLSTCARPTTRRSRSCSSSTHSRSTPSRRS